MGCTWGERWNVSHSGDKGVPGEAGMPKPAASKNFAPWMEGKILPSGFIQNTISAAGDSKLAYEQAVAAMEAAKALERNGRADPYYRRSPRDLAAEVMQLGSLLHTSIQEQAQLVQGQNHIIRTLGEITCQLVTLRQQISILSEQLADCEARQREVEKKVPVDPFVGTQRKRTRVIKRMTQ
jgi:hypothetical protein